MISGYGRSLTVPRVATTQAPGFPLPDEDPHVGVLRLQDHLVRGRSHAGQILVRWVIAPPSNKVRCRASPPAASQLHRSQVQAVSARRAHRAGSSVDATVDSWAAAS